MAPSYLGLTWNSEWRIFICEACASGVRDHEVDAHFRRFHQYPLQHRDKLIDHITSTRQSNSIGDVIIPQVLYHPIPLLTVYHDYYHCRYPGTDCHYVCGKLRDLRTHLQSKHRWKQYTKRGQPSKAARNVIANQKEPFWSRVSCQRFFRAGPQSHFIPILSSTPLETTPESGPDLWQQMAVRVREARQADVNIITNLDDRGTSPWLRRTGWQIYLEGLDRTYLIGLLESPPIDTPVRLVYDAVLSLARKCQSRVKNQASSFTRIALVQTTVESRATRPLQPYLEDADLIRNTRHWQAIILFFLRTRGDQSDITPRYSLQPGQSSHLVDIIRLSQTDNTDIESDNVSLDLAESHYACTELERACLAFFISLLSQRIESDDYESPLICALAVLGIHSTDGGWKTVQQYPSLLSGVIKLARFFVLQFASEHPLAGSTAAGNINQTVQRMTQRLLVRGTQTPIEWMLNIRSYGMHIAAQTTSIARVTWDGEVAMYTNMQFSLSQFRAAIHRLVYDTNCLLMDQLLFTADLSDPLPPIPWTELRDDPTNLSVGWNFLYDSRTVFPVRGEEWLIQQIRRSPKLNQRFRQSHSGQLSQQSVREYFQSLARFRSRLAVLIHVSSQPARVPELLTIRHRNSSQGEPRGIFVESGQVAIITRYHKGSYTKGDVRIVYRFLPRAIGQLLVYYLWLVLPWVETLQAFVFPHSKLSSYLWPSEGEVAPFSAEAFRQTLPQIFTEYLGQSINVRAYRHIAISMAREFLGLDSSLTTSHNGDVDDEFYDPEVDSDNIWDLQAGHSSRTAETVYGRTTSQYMGELGSQKRRFQAISLQWHTFLHFPRLDPPVTTQVLTNAGPMFTRWQRLTESAPLDQLRLLYGDTAAFRHEQDQVLAAIYRGKSPLLAILPTGGGKSLFFMLPASYNWSGTTVVVIPLVAIRQDFLSRAQELGISASIWTRGNISTSTSQLLFVTPESAVQSDFSSYLNHLFTTQQLDRIVIDECHIILDETGSFRNAITKIWHLVQYPVPILCLSATLAPSEEHEFWIRLHFGSRPTHVHRVPTRRENLEYIVREVPTAQRLSIVRAYLRKWSSYKAIIYSPTIELACTMASDLECEPYYASLPHKDQVLTEFRSQASGTLIATNALGLGVHVPGVRLVLHLSPPHTLRSYVQESGRAGRERGQTAMCVLLVPAEDVRSIRESSDRWIRQYLWPDTVQCRRWTLDEYLDGSSPNTCRSASGTLPCDLCVKHRPRQNSQPPALSAVAASLSYQQFQRQNTMNRLAVSQANQDNATTLARVVEWLSIRQNHCFLCLNPSQPKPHAPFACDDPAREQYNARRSNIKTTISFQPFSGCFRCGFPQSHCQRWTRSDAGYSRSHERNCSHGFVLYEAAARLWPYSTFSAGLCQRLGVQHGGEVTESRLIRYFGQKVAFFGLETNNLFREVILHYQDIV